jgi:hypothetical protein
MTSTEYHAPTSPDTNIIPFPIDLLTLLKMRSAERLRRCQERDDRREGREPVPPPAPGPNVTSLAAARYRRNASDPEAADLLARGAEALEDLKKREARDTSELLAACAEMIERQSAILRAGHETGMVAPHVAVEAEKQTAELKVVRSWWLASRKAEVPVIQLDYGQSIEVLRALHRIPGGAAPGKSNWLELQVLKLWKSVYLHASKIAPDASAFSRDITNAIRCRPKGRSVRK